MRQRDYVALGLSAAVVVGMLLTRTSAAAATPTTPQIPSSPTDPNLENARILIRTLEAQAANATPEQRQALATQLETHASMLQAVSPQAARELQEAATRIRGGAAPAPPGPTPPAPPTPPQDATLQQARDLIRALETRATSASPQERQVLAQQLDFAASAVAATNPQAATELKEAATRIRALPTGTGPSISAAQATQAGVVQRYNELKAKAEQYLGDPTATVAMDTATLGAMDRTAAELAAMNTAENNARAQTLVTLATASYGKRGLQRPIAMAL